MKLRQFGYLLALLSGLTACASNPQPTQSAEGWQANIVDSIIRTRQAKTLIAALRASEIESQLKTTGPYTVIAPTDEAFARLPPGTYEDLLEPNNREMLVSLLKYHIIPGRLSVADLAATGQDVMSLQGSTIDVSVDADGVRLNGYRMVRSDVVARNGMVHFVDHVLTPEAAQFGT